MANINYQIGQTKHSIPRADSAASGTKVLAEGIKQLQERIEAEKNSQSTTEIKLDNSNKVNFPGFPYIFEALGEKILVSIDVFKSGYECMTCKGTKTLSSKCYCEAEGHPGLKYSEDDIIEIKETLGEDIGMARAVLVCGECNGDYASLRKESICPECKGLGALLVLPEDSKKLPTTGVVVSRGKYCTRTDFSVGDRIVFGPYAGNMIPTKAGLMFKIMDETQAWCKIEGGEDLGAFDFVIQEKD